jgi:hypothetical protein
MLLAEGIKRAGKNFTRESVIDAINNITDWTANGIRAKLNWKNAHGPSVPGDVDCVGFVAAVDGKFVPQFNTTPEQPFVCFPVNPYPASLSSATLGDGA